MKKQKKKQVKNLYISLIITIALIVIAVVATNPRINPFAIQDSSFNLKVEIADSHKTIQPGEEIYFTTKILNLANKQRKDITLKYEILKENNVITTKSETMAIETQASFVGDLKIPEASEEGNYDLRVTLLVNDVEEASGKDSFQITKKENKTTYYTYVIIIVIIALGLIILITLKLKTIIKKIKIKLKVHKIVEKRLKK